MMMKKNIKQKMFGISIEDGRGLKYKEYREKRSEHDKRRKRKEI
jgi:hypothetical protein